METYYCFIIEIKEHNVVLLKQAIYISEKVHFTNYTQVKKGSSDKLNPLQQCHWRSADQGILENRN